MRASAPVAGFNGMAAKAVARAYGDTGDPEQSAADLFESVDYPHLAALVAPRPLLLAYNAEDDCCFRAGMVKPVIEQPARTVFELYGKGADLVWHENRDPGTHNYQLDNREQAYRFFGRVFRVPAMLTDSPEAASEVRGSDELVVGLPADNLTILDLARRIAAGFSRTPVAPEAGRARLAQRRALPAGPDRRRLARGQHEAARRRDGLVPAADERRAERERRLAEGRLASRDDAPATIAAGRRGPRPGGGRGRRAAEPRRAGAGARPRARWARPGASARRGACSRT